MSSLSEIEAAIEQLPATELRQLSIWLQEYLEEKWDRKIESDLESGRLDRLISQAEAHIAAKQVRDLNEVLNDS